MSNTFFTNSPTELRNQIYMIWNKIEQIALADNDSVLVLFSLFIVKEDYSSENLVVVEEELDVIDIDGIENLEDLPGLKLPLMGESLLEILTKRRSQTFWYRQHCFFNKDVEYFESNM